jgi:hypothetical protein
MSVAFNRLSRPLGPLGRKAFSSATPTVLENGIAGNVRITAMPASPDGLASLRPAPAVTSNATGTLAARGWQGLATIERSIPSPGDLTPIRQAVNVAVRPVKGLGLQTGLPILIAPPPPTGPAPPPSLAAVLTIALRPSAGIRRRFGGRAKIPDTLGGNSGQTRVMACPQFTAPLAMALLSKHKEWLLPGLGNFPDDRVTLVFANGPFIESFMAGVNHEMNRELLWREYPTDQRGTPFRYFWPRPDRNPDIPPITSWNVSTPLGQNGAGNGPDVEDMVVLLVRGELLHRYPSTIVYAAPGVIAGGALGLNTAVDWTPPQFLIKLDGRTTAFAYPLKRTDIQSNIPAGNAGYYFVFSEPITGPRFRFSPTPAADLQLWSDLDWGTVPQARGFAVAGLDLAPPPGENAAGAARWNNDSADAARIAFARPFRVGYHADELLANA